MKAPKALTRICLLYFLIIGFRGFLLSADGKYPIQQFTPSIYQAGNQNIDFAQNRDMTLFVANNLGVLSYNGHKWTKHAFRTGKKNRSLAFDNQTNRLYLGSQGEFGYFENDWDYISLVDQIPEEYRDFDEVWDVFIIDSKVHFCTFEGIFKYDGQTIEVLNLSSGLDQSFLVNNQLFTQNRKGDLYKITQEGFTSSYLQNIKGQVIRGIVQHNDGILIIYNSGHVELSNPVEARPIYKNLSKTLKGTYVNHVLQLSDSRLAISTQTSGLFIFDLYKNSLENINTEDGLATNTCLRSFQDYEGNLWLGLQNGIAQIHINSPLRLVNREINLQGSGYAVLENQDGVYYSTSNGIYFRSKNASQSVFLQGTEGPAYGLTMINGEVYAGHHTGIFLLRRLLAERIALTDGLWTVKQLRSKPEFAIGGGYSGIHLFKFNNEQKLTYVTQINGFNETSRFIEEDKRGNLWVGQYYKGLYNLVLSDDLESVTPLMFSNEPQQKYEQIILSKVDNELTIASNSGVHFLDQIKKKIVPSESFSKFIGDQQVYLFEQDNKKNVHLVSEEAVGFFKQLSAKNYVFVPSSLYNMRYYLNNDLLNLSTEISEGVMFSSNDGFIYYDPKLENQVNINHPIVIKSVYSNQTDTALYLLKPFEIIPSETPRFAINYNQRNLLFNVESFQFSGIHNQRFKYYLKGFDESFGEWTNSAQKEYSNLTEGDYEFTVQTQNYMGEISTSQPMFFSINPPLYRSLAAKIIYTLAGILSIFLLYRFQRLHYRRKEEQLEQKRLIELSEEQQKLKNFEKESSKALSKLQQEKLETELRHTNNLLAASTMNLVVKNEFIESIKDEIQQIGLMGNSPETKNALKGIVKEIDTTLRIHEDWEQFQLHFDQVHGDFLSRLQDEFIDLSPNEQKLCTLLRLNLNTKEIANMMSISLRGVEVARYRLRKKLELEKGQNLSKFILEY